MTLSVFVCSRPGILPFLYDTSLDIKVICRYDGGETVVDRDMVAILAEIERLRADLWEMKASHGVPLQEVGA